VAFVAPVTSKSLPTAQLASSAPAPQGPSSPSTLLGGSAALGAAAVVALASSSGRRRVARRAEQELAKLPKHMQPVDMNKEYPAYVKGKNENSMMPQLVGDWGTPVPGSYK
ncbi:unnamed protein product, partial [Symbiodinium sp. CCMP2456]